MGIYSIIYADPPWLERGSGKIKRGADRHYPLMSTPDICALPVKEWAADNAHLYLWATNNFLPDALQVITAWGSATSPASHGSKATSKKASTAPLIIFKPDSDNTSVAAPNTVSSPFAATYPIAQTSTATALKA